MSYTAEAVRVLASIMRQPEHSDAARVQAASILLDRGWGKPPQAHTGEDGQGALTVVIRHIVEGRDEEQRPLELKTLPNDTGHGEDDPWRHAPF